MSRKYTIFVVGKTTQKKSATFHNTPTQTNNK